jgi:hypothetical protein
MKTLVKILIALSVTYCTFLMTGCKTMQSDVINLKEPISTGGSWIMERKDFKASERKSLDDIDKRLEALDELSRKRRTIYVY